MNKIDSSCESCNFLNISVTMKTKRRERERKGGSLIHMKEREEGQKKELNGSNLEAPLLECLAQGEAMAFYVQPRVKPIYAA